MKCHFGAPAWVSAQSLYENVCFLEGNAGVAIFLRAGSPYNTTGWDPKATPRLQKQTRGGVLGGGGVSETLLTCFQMTFEVLGSTLVKAPGLSTGTLVVLRVATLLHKHGPGWCPHVSGGV